MKLALDGGLPALELPLKTYVWIDPETVSLVANLLGSQQLSGFLGQAGSQYLGGVWLKRLEKQIQDFGNHQFAIGFNSWTSGLEAIFIALGLPKNSEVIVPTWTMSATISAIVNSNLTPVFADINENTFNISPSDVLSKITPNTSAICSVDLFGRPSPMNDLRIIADKFNLRLITDSAQCPGGRINGVSPSKIADIGGYSFNRHKHIQSGEGGMVVTDDFVLADRLRAIRNHGEIAAPQVLIDSESIYGHNWRLGEIESLIAFQQYQKVTDHLEYRRNVAQKLLDKLSKFEWLLFSESESSVVHDYYILGMRLHAKVNRDFVASSLQAEGIHFLITKYSGLELLPAFSKFHKLPLTNAAHLNDYSFLGLYLAGFTFDGDTIDSITKAFEKTFTDPRAFN